MLYWRSSSTGACTPSMAPLKIEVPASKSGSGDAGPRSTRSTRIYHARRQENKKGGRCSVCQGDHFVMFCEEYKKKTASEREQHVTASNLCANCLGRHKTSECASTKNCSACGGRHHSSLHDAFRGSETAKTSHISQRHRSRLLCSRLPRLLASSARAPRPRLGIVYRVGTSRPTITVIALSGIDYSVRRRWKKIRSV